MHVAHLNTSRALAPFDHPLMAGFVDSIARVNATADAAPGFVWRLDDDPDDSIADPVLLGDSLLLVNISVWTDVQALRSWVYGDAAHLEIMKRRHEWFEADDSEFTVPTVCWWVAEGHRPSVAEAEWALLHLRAHGPSETAFPLERAHPR
ncbi:MAG: DUF3291 domain-containing protein [Actinobacteria bacterium]|nr:DUF3291 domain-containing protein [Actinomycetota bacterium]MSW40744.1 DUF3291 domain-containing protein [Actinomycetota bacterium]